MGRPRTQRPPITGMFEGRRVWQIPLTQGLFAFVDDTAIAPVARHTWCAKRDGNTVYVLTKVRSLDGRMKTLYLHQLIWELLGNEGPVDHKNGDGLDNRNCNLRAGPGVLNSMNRRKQVSAAASAFKGVWWRKDCRKWKSGITEHGRRLHLGYFEDEEQAARAYDAAAQRYFGEYSNLNFPTLERTG